MDDITIRLRLPSGHTSLDHERSEAAEEIERLREALDDTLTFTRRLREIGQRVIDAQEDVALRSRDPNAFVRLVFAARNSALETLLEHVSLCRTGDALVSNLQDQPAETPQDP